MLSKIEARAQALALRKQGLSYREILENVHVAKSTLSLWLRSVGLSKKQRQRLTDKKLRAMARGWAKVRANRISRIQEIKKTADAEFRKYYKDPLWVLGTTLYWGEGNKIKAWDNSAEVIFSNMDVLAITAMRKWLQRYCEVRQEDIHYSLYIHETAHMRLGTILQYWAEKLGVSLEGISVYYKRNKLSATKRRNTGVTYYGVIRLKVRKSTALGHKIDMWMKLLSEYYCRVV